MTADAQAVPWDTSFGYPESGGTVTLSSEVSGAEEPLIRDGRIWVNASRSDVARLNVHSESSGRRDTDFPNGLELVGSFGIPGFDVDALGRVVYTTTSLLPSGDGVLDVRRLNRDGSLDLSFQSEGVVFPFGFRRDSVHAMADGTYILSGARSIWRLMSDGTVDLSFGADDGAVGDGEIALRGFSNIELSADRSTITAATTAFVGGVNTLLVDRYSPSAGLIDQFERRAFPQAGVNHHVALADNSVVVAGSNDGLQGDLIVFDPDGNEVFTEAAAFGVQELVAYEAGFVTFRLADFSSQQADAAAFNNDGTPNPSALSNGGIPIAEFRPIAAVDAQNDFIVVSNIFGEASTSTIMRRYLGESPQGTSGTRYSGVTLDVLHHPSGTRPEVSDPVNTASGALVAAVQDLEAPAGSARLSLMRSYDSSRSEATLFGRGWASNWDHTLRADEENVEYVSEHGRRFTFTESGDGTFERPDELFADVVAGPDGMELAWFDGERWSFDADGYLVATRAWDGTGVDIIRNEAGAPSLIASTTGETLSMFYDTDGRMASAVLSDGREATYGYSDAGFLESVTNPDGSMSYAHDAEGRIVSEVDATGVVMHDTEYGEDGRVARQVLPAGEESLFAYDDTLLTTTVSDVDSGDTVVYVFDESGELTAVRDPDGNVTLSSWSDDALPTGSTDRLGHNPSASYDANGNVISVTDPVRGVTSYTYDTSNRVTAVTEPTGAVTSMTYAGTERIPEIVTDALGNSTTFTIDDGLVTAVLDADGVSTSYVYDTQRRMVEMTNGLGYSWSYEYDAVGRQTGSTTPLGFVTSRAFDDAGRMLTSTAADGGVTTYSYDADGRVLSTTDPVGAVTSNTYDPTTGLLAATTDPAGRVTVYTYNALSELVAVEANDGGVSETDYGTLGRVTATRDPLGRETTNAYDANGNRTEVVAPDGGVTRTEFDTAGRISSLEDPIGRRTTHAYDDFGRLLSVTQPDGTVMSYTYDLLGRQVETIAPDGGVTAMAFTPAGRTESVTDPEAGVTSYSYDAAGQMNAVTDPNGFITAFDYDPDGRRTAVITPEGLITNWEYDPMGRVTKIIDPAGVELARTYTLRGELETEQREGDGVVNYVYNADGTMASVADALGNTTTFTYDAAGRQDTRVDVTGAVEVMEYNVAGELVAQVDRLGQRTEIGYDSNGRIDTVADPSGRTTDHDYDTAGQLLDRTFGDGTTISYEYDDLGRRIEMDDPTGITTYDYDANGRPVEVAAPNGTLGYSYDLAGRRTGLTYPDGTTVRYDYDAAGRLIGLTDPNTGDVDYTLDDDGRLVLAELPDGATRSFEFVDGQMVNHQDHGRTTALTYDESGRIATLSGAQDHVYTYDAAGQLLNAAQDEGTYAYTYGTRGEITSITDPDRTRTFTHNANVEIATIVDGDGGTGSVSYDEAGRMVEHADPDGTVTTYVYDARGLLVETTITTLGDGGGGPEVDPCAGLVPTITGTEGDDVIEGTWQDDIIFGLGGNDVISGRSGSDVICGGDGDDTISGDSQDDTIYAGPGNDTVSGDSGGDTIDGGPGDDTLEGNSQADTIQGGDGDDTINGNSGPDTLDGGNGDDVVDGSWQNDTCDDAEQAISCETITFNGESNDPPIDPPGTPILCNGLVATIVGTEDDDVLNGTWQDDVIVGYGGNDTINGQSGADTICGGPGDDVINGQSQGDTILGEAGNDTISGASGADTIDGGPGDDTISGDSQSDLIFGDLGVDDVNGGPGDDRLVGLGASTLNGLWGTDTCSEVSTAINCEAAASAAHDAGLDRPVGLSGNEIEAPGAASTLSVESRVFDGEAQLVAVTRAPSSGEEDLAVLWDSVAATPHILTLNGESAVQGKQRELFAGVPESFTALGDSYEPAVLVGPFGERSDAMTGAAFGYRGELSLLTGVHLRSRDLATDLGVFLTPDPLAGVLGENVLSNSYHYAGNDPIGQIDPLGLRPGDAQFVVSVSVIAADPQEYLDELFSCSGFSVCHVGRFLEGGGNSVVSLPGEVLHVATNPIQTAEEFGALAGHCSRSGISLDQCFVVAQVQSTRAVAAEEGWWFALGGFTVDNLSLPSGGAGFAKFSAWIGRVAATMKRVPDTPNAPTGLADDGARFVVDSAGSTTLRAKGPQGWIDVSEHAAQRMTQRGISIDAVDNALTARPFNYFHDGIWKVGYYDPGSRVFVGTVNGNATTVIKTGPNYINNLKAAHP